MKKLVATILASCMFMLTAPMAFAATTPYICPNGNTACVQNGSCPTDGNCQYTTGCRNGRTPQRDGTGMQGRGAGHCGGGRNR